VDRRARADPTVRPRAHDARRTRDRCWPGYRRAGRYRGHPRGKSRRLGTPCRASTGVGDSGLWAPRGTWGRTGGAADPRRATTSTDRVPDRPPDPARRPRAHRRPTAGGPRALGTSRRPRFAHAPQGTAW